ncbi:MAG: radical SAM protein, partial [Thermodesulfobacteriota bacterium]
MRNSRNANSASDSRPTAPPVLLVSPPQRRIRFNLSGVFPMQPLGIAALAAYLRQRNVSVKVLDAVALRLDAARTVDAVLAAKPALAAFSTTIFNIADTGEIARAVKERAPGLPVVLGGHGMVFPAEALAERLAHVDFFIRGEGEEALFRLVEALRNGKDLEDVPGLVHRRDGRILDNPKGPALDPDRLPLPALDLLPPVRYAMHPPFNQKPPLCLVETARGCGFSCNFCSIRRTLRVRSTERVLEEIRWAKKVFSAREIHFVDPTFTARRDRALELCEAIGRSFPGLAWTCKTRVDCLDPELARAMARSGCYMVSLGVESGSQRMLDAMSKSVTVEQIHAAA